MSYTPPGVTPPTAFALGIHRACILVDFKVAKPSRDGKYQFAYVASYRDTEAEGCPEIEDWIKWTGGQNDIYAGQRIERLHAIFEAKLPSDGEIVDCQNILALSDGVFFTVEINDKGFVKDVRSNSASSASGF